MPGCIYNNLEKDYSIEDLAAFHGHLGPYIVLGYRMGKYAKRYFCNDPFHMNANVHCNGVPPQSCLVDGVQIGSGCTLGKRNIEITVSDSIKCEFVSDDKKVVLTPKPIKFPPRDAEDYFKKIEALAVQMYNMDDVDLFEAGKN
nr:formylmethanofuran dehydrogenase subunit E family protein [Methanocella sp. CWC-04]